MQPSRRGSWRRVGRSAAPGLALPPVGRRRPRPRRRPGARAPAVPPDGGPGAPRPPLRLHADEPALRAYHKTASRGPAWVAARHQDWRWHFAGAEARPGVAERLHGVSGVTVDAAIPHARLARVVAGWPVGLIPRLPEPWGSAVHPSTPTHPWPPGCGSSPAPMVALGPVNGPGLGRPRGRGPSAGRAAGGGPRGPVRRCRRRLHLGLPAQRPHRRGGGGPLRPARGCGPAPPREGCDGYPRRGRVTAAGPDTGRGPPGDAGRRPLSATGLTTGGTPRCRPS